MDLKGDLRRMLKIFYAPTSVFAEIKNKEAGIYWLTPLVIILIAVIISSYLVIPNIIIPQQIERTVEQIDDEAEVENRIEYFTSSYHYYTSFFAEIGKKLSFFFILALLLSMLQLYFGGEKLTYSYFFTGVVYVGIIKSVGLIFDSYLQYRVSSFEAGLHLAAVFPEASGYWSHFLRTLTLFSFWQVILLAIMLKVFYNYSKRKSYFLMFSIWIVWCLIIAYFNNLQEIVRS